MAINTPTRGRGVINNGYHDRGRDARRVRERRWFAVTSTDGITFESGGGVAKGPIGPLRLLSSYAVSGYGPIV